MIAPMYTSNIVISGQLNLLVQDASGNQLTATSDTYTLPADGTYTVALGGGATGTFSLGV